MIRVSLFCGAPLNGNDTSLVSERTCISGLNDIKILFTFKLAPFANPHTRKEKSCGTLKNQEEYLCFAVV